MLLNAMEFCYIYIFPNANLFPGRLVELVVVGGTWATILDLVYLKMDVLLSYTQEPNNYTNNPKP